MAKNTRFYVTLSHRLTELVKKEAAGLNLPPTTRCAQIIHLHFEKAISGVLHVDAHAPVARPSQVELEREAAHMLAERLVDAERKLEVYRSAKQDVMHKLGLD